MNNAECVWMFFAAVLAMTAGALSAKNTELKEQLQQCEQKLQPNKVEEPQVEDAVHAVPQQHGLVLRVRTQEDPWQGCSSYKHCM